MGFVRGVIPLEANRKYISAFQKPWEEKIGNNLQAMQYRKQNYLEPLRVASLKSREAEEAEIQRYCGNIVNTQIDMMMYTTSIASALFEMVPWVGENIPAYSLKYHPSLRVVRMAAWGEPPQKIAYTSETQYFPQLYIISTDKVYQPRRSVLTGNTGPDEVVNQDMRYEVIQKIEDDVWTLLEAAVGAFTTDVTWQYDTRIQGLPTSNDYDFSDEGGLTVSLFRRILAAIDLIPSRTRPGEPVEIRNMFVANSSMQDVREWVSVVSNIDAGASGSSNDNQTIVTPDLHRAIEVSGPSAVQSMWGQNVGIRPVNRLMGTSAADFGKYLYVFFNEPVGRLYVRPEEDRTETYMDKWPRSVGFMMWREIGMEIPYPWRPNFMKVQYST